MHGLGIQKHAVYEKHMGHHPGVSQGLQFVRCWCWVVSSAWRNSSPFVDKNCRGMSNGSIFKYCLQCIIMSYRFYSVLVDCVDSDSFNRLCSPCQHKANSHVTQAAHMYNMFMWAHSESICWGVGDCMLCFIIWKFELDQSGTWILILPWPAQCFVVYRLGQIRSH